MDDLTTAVVVLIISAIILIVAVVIAGYALCCSTKPLLVLVPKKYWPKNQQTDDVADPAPPTRNSIQNVPDFRSEYVQNSTSKKRSTKWRTAPGVTTNTVTGPGYRQRKGLNQTQRELIRKQLAASVEVAAKMRQRIQSQDVQEKVRSPLDTVWSGEIRQTGARNVAFASDESSSQTFQKLPRSATFGGFPLPSAPSMEDIENKPFPPKRHRPNQIRISPPSQTDAMLTDTSSPGSDFARPGERRRCITLD